MDDPWSVTRLTKSIQESKLVVFLETSTTIIIWSTIFILLTPSLCILTNSSVSTGPRFV